MSADTKPGALDLDAIRARYKEASGDGHPALPVPIGRMSESNRDILALVAEVEVLRARYKALWNALAEDASGRPVTELMRIAADGLTANGGGPIVDCLRMKADEIDDLAAGSNPAQGEAGT